MVGESTQLDRSTEFVLYLSVGKHVDRMGGRP
jgi:hypothetical protein